MELGVTAREDVLVTKVEFREAMLASKNDLREAMAAVKIDLNDAFHVLDLKIEALRGEMRAAIAGSEGKLTRWVFTCMLGQTAVLIGAMYFALRHLH